MCTAPSSITNSATEILDNSATVNGTVNANNNSTTVSFEYGTTTSYGMERTAIPNSVEGSINTNISAGITGLNSNTLYHFRVKAVNCGGTTYGSDQTFTTLCAVPSATTYPATIVLITSARLNGVVNANSSSTTVTFEYGTNTSYGYSVTATPNPVELNFNTSVIAEITGLSSNTTYHFRIKAVNCGGTIYGSDQTFTTESTLLTDIEGNLYNVIEIGNQVWMQENLKTTKYNDGESIPRYTILSPSGWRDLTTPVYCYNNNDSISYHDVYGPLYNGFTVETGKLCPVGWHIPTDDEFSILATYLGGESVAGGKLKELGTVHWWSPNTGATNESGFTALPGGNIAGSTGLFSSTGNVSVLWSVNPTNYTFFLMWYDKISCLVNYTSIKDGNSVRCIKD